MCSQNYEEKDNVQEIETRSHVWGHDWLQRSEGILFHFCSLMHSHVSLWCFLVVVLQFDFPLLPLYLVSVYNPFIHLQWPVNSVMIKKKCLGNLSNQTNPSIVYFFYLFIIIIIIIKNSTCSALLLVTEYSVRRSEPISRNFFYDYWRWGDKT